MDTLLCDELLQEIFHRVPPPYSAAVALVSKRWRRVLRSSTTSLSLHVPPPYYPTTVANFCSFLTQHPFLSSLSVAGSGGRGGEELRLLAAVSASCPNLRHLRFVKSPVPLFSLYTLSKSCVHLSSIAVTISRPLSFYWLRHFSSLKSLSLILAYPLMEAENPQVNDDDKFDVGLSLESLSLTGILPGDYRLSYLWRNCRNVKKLKLKSCESVGDHSSFSEFLRSLTCLRELKLKTSRNIVNVVLLTLAENCVSLDTLSIYDGGSKEGLLQFINQSKCSLKNLFLRLPLDLDNNHLIAFSGNLNFRGLMSLRLQSCSLVTGEGLTVLGRAIGNGLEELALIACDILEKESGLLATLGQNLKKLKKLDLSYNNRLFDKDIASILVSCNGLVELKLRGCHGLSNACVGSMVRNCKQLQSVDIMCCCRIDLEGVEFILMNAQRLRLLEVEKGKVSEVAGKWAVDKFVEIVSDTHLGGHVSSLINY